MARHVSPPLTYYLNYLRTGAVLRSTGPLWFAAALLLFCLVLATWRTLRGPRSPESSGAGDDHARRWDGSAGHPASPAAVAPDPLEVAGVGPHQEVDTAPNSRQIWSFALVLGLGSFVVRLVQPIGSSILNFQLCFFVQYIAFFVVGLKAARNGWLLALAHSSRARHAGRVVLLAGTLLVVSIAWDAHTGGIQLERFFGGRRWQAFAFALWEQFAGVALSLRLLAFFSRHMDRDTPRLRWLADRSFGVYVLHAPVLVGLFMVYRSLPQSLWFMPLLLTVTGLLLSYLLADGARRVPGLRAIL